jgi:hypothetical protein
MVSPREARVEGPIKALAAGGVLATLSPAAPALAADGKTFQTALNQYFPLSRTSNEMIDQVVATLSRRQFSKSNTLFGSSVCPDEINSKPGKSLAAAMQAALTDQNGLFTLGGLGGIPFVGISGLKAFMSHTPDKGKVVIMYGPHIGISDDGVAGKVERLGRAGVSGSCGAALGALKVIQGEMQAQPGGVMGGSSTAPSPTPALTPGQAAGTAAGAAAGLLRPKPANAAEIVNAAQAPMPKQTVMDNQEEYIIRKLRPRLTSPTAMSVSKAAAPAYVTYQMFDLVEELLIEELRAFWKDASSWDNIDEVVLLGGVVVNRGQFSGSIEARQDYYHPMVFESYKKPETAGAFPKPSDLFGETFGGRADSWFD